MSFAEAFSNYMSGRKKSWPPKKNHAWLVLHSTSKQAVKAGPLVLFKFILFEWGTGRISPSIEDNFSARKIYCTDNLFFYFAAANSLFVRS